MTAFLIKLIKLYQDFFSPDYSPWGKTKFPYGFCQFYPSCSEYMKQSLQKFGLLRGIGRGAYRILRCNPFSNGGFDPIIKGEKGK